MRQLIAFLILLSVSCSTTIDEAKTKLDASAATALEGAQARLDQSIDRAVEKLSDASAKALEGAKAKADSVVSDGLVKVDQHIPEWIAEIESRVDALSIRVLDRVETRVDAATTRALDNIEARIRKLEENAINSLSGGLSPDDAEKFREAAKSRGILSAVREYLKELVITGIFALLGLGGTVFAVRRRLKRFQTEAAEKTTESNQYKELAELVINAVEEAKAESVKNVVSKKIDSRTDEYVIRERIRRLKGAASGTTRQRNQ